MNDKHNFWGFPLAFYTKTDSSDIEFKSRNNSDIPYPCKYSGVKNADNAQNSFSSNTNRNYTNEQIWDYR